MHASACAEPHDPETHHGGLHAGAVEGAPVLEELCKALLLRYLAQLEPEPGAGVLDGEQLLHAHAERLGADCKEWVLDYGVLRSVTGHAEPGLGVVQQQQLTITSMSRTSFLLSCAAPPPAAAAALVCSRPLGLLGALKAPQAVREPATGLPWHPSRLICVMSAEK